MTDKEMEGDNARRRALAREARKQGRRPSEAGVTLGSSKQPEHVRHADREGPPPAGAHKPVAGRVDLPEKGRPEPEWPRHPVTGEPDRAPGIRYRELITEVARRTGLDVDRARLATEATVTVLIRAVDDAGRERLLDRVPAELHDDYAVRVPYHPRDLPHFLAEVGRIAHASPEEARYRAQTVLSLIAAQDPELIGSLDLPPDLRDLTGPPPTGTVTADGHPAPLTDAELRSALTRLPYWGGTVEALTRTIALPPDSLDRVLGRLDRLRRDLGRGPRISRPDPRTAVLVVRTSAVGAVTAKDVDLAHRIDAAIEEAGAGMA
jgi:pterin-4a-carbinolamine dehydratase